MRFKIIIILLVAAVAVGCANAALKNPATPSVSTISQPATESNWYLFGMWDLSISGDRRDVKITPLRTAGMHLNAVRMVETSPCNSCLTIQKVEQVNPGRINITIRVRHPFSTQYPKLTGFDVRGIVMLPGSYSFPNAGVTVSREELGDSVLLGPDGYTRLFNPSEFPVGTPPALHYIKGKYSDPDIKPAILNPYLVFVPSGATRNCFQPSAQATRTYDLKLPPGPVRLGYAVDCSWIQVDGEIKNIPDDFPISANCMEAYKIWVSIGKGLTPTGTGAANVKIEASDWQGKDTIDKVLIEAPGIFSGEVEAGFSTVVGESIVYTAKIKNTLLAPIGDYPLLVTVKDKEKDPNLGEVSAYQVATAHVTLTGVWLRELVHIPAGEFLMGGDPSVDPQVQSWEEPQHLHPTGEYYIGRYELTNEEYAQFMADGGYDDPQWWSTEGWSCRINGGWTAPAMWNDWPEKTVRVGSSFPDYPITSVSWYEAEAFCNWAGGRLPSEAEWEKAARGTDGRIFPWGNDWDVNKCQCDKNGVGPTPVGEHSPEGDSPYGAADTIGNVEEFVQDWYDINIYTQYATGDFTPPTAPFPYPDFKGARGANFSLTYGDGYYRTSSRNGEPVNMQMAPTGFRVAFNP